MLKPLGDIIPQLLAEIAKKRQAWLNKPVEQPPPSANQNNPPARPAS